VTDAQRLRGYPIAFIAMVSWSASGVFISYLTTRFRMPPLVLAFWRDLLVTCTLLGTLALFSRRLLHVRRQHLPFLLAYGFVLGILSGLWTVSVALNGAPVATVLIYTSPAFTALIGWQWRDERVSGLTAVAIGFSIAGCVFASGAHNPSVWQLNARGILFGLGAGLSFTFYSLLGKASLARGINPWTTTLYTFAFGSAFLLLAQRPATLLWLSRPLAEGPGGWHEAVLGWGTVLLLAVGPTLGGYGLYSVSLGYLPASAANLIMTLEPAMTAMLAYVLLGDQMSGAQFLGGAIILVGVFILRLGDHGASLRDLSTG
jgi:drug/metabolite transporter (DMT)-like permease